MDCTVNKNKNPIIFVVIHPFAERDYHRFGAEYLEEQGYDVRVWRVVTSGSIKMEWTAGMYRGKNYSELSVREYKKGIKEFGDKAVFIFQGKPRELFAVAKQGCRYIVFDGMCPQGLPVPEDESVKRVPLPTDMSSRIHRIADAGIAAYIRKKIDDRIGPVRLAQLSKNHPPMFTVTTTKYAEKFFLSREDFQHPVVYTHALDYDCYVEANREAPESEKKCIVYCDGQMFQKGYDSYLTDEWYADRESQKFYAQLDKLFSKLEEHYNLPVVIAGSPHVEYENDSIFGRKVIFNKTCDLTRDAAVFITTMTTAMNFPLLYDTPSLKVANGALKTVSAGDYCNTFAYIKDEADKMFGCGFLDLDDDEMMEHPWDFVKKCDPQMRAAYLEKYVIDNDTTDKTVMECVETLWKTK